MYIHQSSIFSSHDMKRAECLVRHSDGAHIREAFMFWGGNMTICRSRDTFTHSSSVFRLKNSTDFQEIFGKCLSDSWFEWHEREWTMTVMIFRCFWVNDEWNLTVIMSWRYCKSFVTHSSVNRSLMKPAQTMTDRAAGSERKRNWSHLQTEDASQKHTALPHAGFLQKHIFSIVLLTKLFKLKILTESW